jgi:hypothetical protein
VEIFLPSYVIYLPACQKTKAIPKTWGVVPTGAGYVPTSAGGKNGGGQVEQLAAMVRLTDKVQLKTNQLRGIIDKKGGNTTEHNIQQFGLLQSFLQMDFQNEADTRQHFLKKMAGNSVPVSPEDVPLGGCILVLDTCWLVVR